MDTVITRIAPSPTGEMHIGTVRTALFNYLFAKHHNGTFLVRIEDTDEERNRPEWSEAILKDLEWCGLIPDSVFIQSAHRADHTELLRELVKNGEAYVSEEESRNDRGKKISVVRLKNPGVTVTFNDLIRGEVTFDTTELGDFVIARSLDSPLYHFAVVADDAAAKVTHVIRAEEHLSNTPRQILIQEALGIPRPHYAHIPLILAPDRSKLSKRKHAASLRHYRERGFIPEGVINYLALLGWNPGGDEELFTLDELVTRFSLDQVHTSGAVFDETKMRWFNREHLLKVSSQQFAETSREYFSEKTGAALEKTGRLDAAIKLLRERIETYGDIAEMERAGEFAYLVETPEYAPEGLLWKDETPSQAKMHLEAVLKLLEAVSDTHWGGQSIKGTVWAYAEREGKGSVLWPFRFALTGRQKSPDPFEVAGILGKNETNSRLTHALSKL